MKLCKSCANFAIYFTTLLDTCAMAFLCYMLKVVPLRRERAL